MKTIRSFDFRQLNIYLWDSEKLAIRVRDFLSHDRAGVFWSYHTGSRGGMSDEPAAIFLEEDLLNENGFQPCTWFFTAWPLNFILVPVTFNGNDFDVWIPLSKFNSSFSEQEREELARRNPKYFSDEPDRKLGFFDENLNEEINRDFGSDEQIANIMNEPDITLEEKCRRLFDRTPEHIFTFGMASFYTMSELYDIARQNGVYEEFTSNISRLRGQCNRWKHDHTSRIGCTTVMCISNQTEPLTVQGSYDYYVNNTNTSRFYGQGTSYPPFQWWAYLKYCIEVFEEAVGYTQVKEKKLGFFDEDMNMKLDLVQESIDRDLTVEQITDIMEDQNLTGEQKSQKLFGRPEGYVAHLQYLVMSATGFCFDYLDDHNFISEKAIHDLGWPEIRNKLTHAADNCLSLARNTTIGVATVFYTIRDCLNLDGSWEYYGKDQDADVRYDWWSYIKNCIDRIEEETEEYGILQHEGQPKQLGFFTESLDNDWLRNNFGITFEQLQELIERNWEDDWYDENTGRYIEQFCLAWRRGQYPNADDTGIVSPCYDNCGGDHFDSLEAMCSYYSEEFIKEWITKYLEWCEQHGFWTRSQKCLGFFDD